MGTRTLARYLAVFIVVITVGGPAAAGTASQAPAARSKVCAAAGELIQRGQPQRALDLIARARSAVPSDRAHRRCAPQYAVALRRQAQAERLVVWVETLLRHNPEDSAADVAQPSPMTCGRPPKALGTDVTVERATTIGVARALQCDRSNERALAIQQSLLPSTTQDPPPVTPPPVTPPPVIVTVTPPPITVGAPPITVNPPPITVTVTPAPVAPSPSTPPATEKTPPEELDDSWDALKTGYLEPWQGLLTAFLIWMVGSMLLVRLLPRIFQNQGLRLSDETARSPNRRIGIQVAGWAVVAIGGSLVTLFAAKAESLTWDRVVAAVAVSVVGIFFIDQARRVAPSLQVIASGEGVTADHVRVVLHTLGTRPPRGWKCQQVRTRLSCRTSGSRATARAPSSRLLPG